VGVENDEMEKEKGTVVPVMLNLFGFSEDGISSGVSLLQRDVDVWSYLLQGTEHQRAEDASDR